MVTIGRVHVAYADASLDIRAGVATEGMRFHTADDNWQQAFERDLRKPILKLVALDRASVYVLPQVRLRCQTPEIIAFDHTGTMADAVALSPTFAMKCWENLESRLNHCMAYGVVALTFLTPCHTRRCPASFVGSVAAAVAAVMGTIPQATARGSA